MVKDKEGRRTARRCSMEELQPEVNWGRSFSLARLKGLSPDNKSVLLNVLHQLLPRERERERESSDYSPTRTRTVICAGLGLWTLSFMP